MEPNLIPGLDLWFPPGLGNASGYGYAAEQFVAALNRKGIRTDFDSGKHKVRISWVQPLYNAMAKEDQYNINYVPWESTMIEDSWKFYMNAMDEIWTPSEFCKKVFRENGITVPINVVPHGTNPEHFPILHQGKHDKFTFGHIGGGTERKGAQRVFDAFLDLFDGNENVQLLMKSNGPSEARYRDSAERLHNVSYHPQVRVNEVSITTEEVSKFYSEIDCMVYPSRGEGFGLIPFDAIASGIPTIVTNATAMSDYAHLGIPLDFNWTDGYGIHLGKWADPNPKHLRELMLRTYENWEDEKERALESAEFLKATQTWDNIADQMIEILGDKLNELV